MMPYCHSLRNLACKQEMLQLQNMVLVVIMTQTGPNHTVVPMRIVEILEVSTGWLLG